VKFKANKRRSRDSNKSKTLSKFNAEKTGARMQRKTDLSKQLLSAQRLAAMFKRISAMSESEHSKMWNRALERFIKNGGDFSCERSEKESIEVDKP
jgi:hypothetical protein